MAVVCSKLSQPVLLHTSLLDSLTVVNHGAAAALFACGWPIESLTATATPASGSLSRRSRRGRTAASLRALGRGGDSSAGSRSRSASRSIRNGNGALRLRRRGACRRSSAASSRVGRSRASFDVGNVCDNLRVGGGAARTKLTNASVGGRNVTGRDSLPDRLGGANGFDGGGVSERAELAGLGEGVDLAVTSKGRRAGGGVARRRYVEDSAAVAESLRGKRRLAVLEDVALDEDGGTILGVEVVAAKCVSCPKLRMVLAES